MRKSMCGCVGKIFRRQTGFRKSTSIAPSICASTDLSAGFCPLDPQPCGDRGVTPTSRFDPRYVIASNINLAVFQQSFLRLAEGVSLDVRPDTAVSPVI